MLRFSLNRNKHKPLLITMIGYENKPEQACRWGIPFKALRYRDKSSEITSIFYFTRYNIHMKCKIFEIGIRFTLLEFIYFLLTIGIQTLFQASQYQFFTFTYIEYVKNWNNISKNTLKKCVFSM